jgi:hypothetical protein
MEECGTNGITIEVVPYIRIVTIWIQPADRGEKRLLVRIWNAALAQKTRGMGINKCLTCALHDRRT